MHVERLRWTPPCGWNLKTLTQFKPDLILYFGSRSTRLGFCSYGEISPHAVSELCELHNQTMTVTAITEVAD